MGGASATCLDPSRLVWPILAVALAGSDTEPSSATVTRACQLSVSIALILPTVTSLTMTGEFGLIDVTSGISITTEKLPSPRPAAPGSDTEFSPLH